MGMWEPLLGLLILRCFGPAAVSAAPEAFYTTGISLNEVTKAVKEGRGVFFDNSQPAADGTYQLKLQLQNVGSRTVAAQSFLTSIYLGTYSSSIPSGATPLLSVPAQGKLPSLQPGQKWPGEGVLVSIPASALPPTSPCEPWNLTLVVDSAFTFVSGASVSQTSQREVLPVSIRAKCMAPVAASGAAPLQVAITTPEHYVQTDRTQIPVLIDFGGRVMEQHPLRLFKVEGSSRVDAVYAVDRGRLYLVVYVNNPDMPRQISISTPPDVAATAGGVSNAGASLQLYYEPRSDGWKAASTALSAVLAGTATASWGTSFLTSCLRPTTTAGSLGYGMLGHLLWAQKFFLTSLLGTPKLPAVYRTAADAFRWTSFHVKRPWMHDSPPLDVGLAFQGNSMLEVDGNGNLLAYSGNGSVITYTPSPSPTMDSLTQPAPEVQDFNSPSDPGAANLPAPAQPSPPPGPVTSSPLSGPSPSNQQPLPSPSSASAGAARVAAPSPPAALPPRSPPPPPALTSPPPNDILGNNETPPVIVAPSPSPKPRPAESPSVQPMNATGGAGVGGGIASPSILDRLLGSKRRILSTAGGHQDGGRALLQQDKHWSLVPGNTRYVLASMVPSSPSKAAPTNYLTGKDAWVHARTIVNQASPYVDKYNILLDITFWAGGFFLVACLINLGGWLVVRCCSAELPGVLHAPRMQLVCIMLALMVLGEAGARLFSHGLAALLVGLAVLTCFPLTFLLLAYLACTGPLYRKEKAVYLLSRSNRKESEGNSCIRVLVLRCLGLSRHRGKWKPADPSARNSFVFRWGPVFEDCRGPPCAYRRLATSSRPSLLHSSSLSPEVLMQPDKRGGSKALALADPPVTVCACVSLHRSALQVHGVLVSLARLAAYGVIIGALVAQPLLQAGLLASLSLFYLAYLRLVVPYSRPGEMAVEYWAALVDVAIFGITLALNALPSTPTSGLNPTGFAMLGLQWAGYGAYFLHRAVTIVGAWSEVVWPACCRPRDSSSVDLSSHKLSSLAISKDSGATLTLQASACNSEGKVATECSEALQEGSSSSGGGPGAMQLSDAALKVPPPVRVSVLSISDNITTATVQEETELRLATPLAPTCTHLPPPVSPSLSQAAFTQQFAGVEVHTISALCGQKSEEAQPQSASNLGSRPGTGEWQDATVARTAVWERFWNYI